MNREMLTHLMTLGRKALIVDDTLIVKDREAPDPGVAFGAVPSPRDDRDFLYRCIKPSLGVLPARFILPEWPVNDQGKLGTCVGQAASAGEEYDEAMERKKAVGSLKVSPEYIYAECKQIDGIPDKPGTYGRTAMKVLVDRGAVLTSEFPPLTRDTNVSAPSSTVRAKAKKFQNTAYAAVESIEEIKHAIMTEGPVLGCFIWVENMMYPEDGFINMPRGYMMGGHAVAITGWDDNLTHQFDCAEWNGQRTFKGWFRVRNSWGSGWGDNGYCWIPYQLFYSKIDGQIPYMTEGWSAVDKIDEGVKPTPEPMPEPDMKGVKHYFDVAPTIIAGRTMVEMRSLAELLGAVLGWDNQQKIATLEWPGRKVYLRVGSKEYTEELRG